MTSKATTYCGAITIVATIVAQSNFGPDINKICGCIAAVATGLGLYFARDNKVSDEQAGAGESL